MFAIIYPWVLRNIWSCLTSKPVEPIVSERVKELVEAVVKLELSVKLA